MSGCTDGWCSVDAEHTGRAHDDDDDENDEDDDDTDEDDAVIRCAADATVAEAHGKAAKVSAPYFAASCRHTCKYSYMLTDSITGTRT